eukprot:TRINITY_DN15597_c0_g2_i1.p1 TRINITY_DN15597_c0_g2~~TRINITY_DN15597_c0_g2_i1.p1  ORF type:complete len:118 (-),score=1.10 TRINITY_DN15597_c0_g2_i1:316-669(-)
MCVSVMSFINPSLPPSLGVFFCVFFFNLSPSQLLRFGFQLESEEKWGVEVGTGLFKKKKKTHWNATYFKKKKKRIRSCGFARKKIHSPPPQCLPSLSPHIISTRAYQRSLRKLTLDQ